MLKMTSLRKSVQKASRAPSQTIQRKTKPRNRSTALHPLLRLQQTVGNQAVGQLIQANLKVSQPGDQYEQEADRVADAVMRMPEPQAQQEAAVYGESPGVRVQRVGMECEDELHRQPIEEEEEEDTLQAKEVSGRNLDVSPDVQAEVNALRGGGQPLPESVRAFFEPRFGYDFGVVRIHTDAKTAESARAVNALAYTVGRDVVFGSGQYRPEMGEGKRLLAHELAHVVQQGVGATFLRICSQIQTAFL